jgi:[acyl-carrier-protein] S-malonyltransferase
LSGSQAVFPPRDSRTRDTLRLASRDADPSITLLSNRDGGVVTSGSDSLERIVGQVAAPVRWDRCTETMRSLGVTTLIELPPAGTLTGIAKRALRGERLLPVRPRMTWTAHDSS